MILERLCQTNMEKTSGYGTDEYCASARRKIAPRDPMLTISVSKIARYFPTGYTQEQMVGIIMQLLERNSRHLMLEKQTSLER